MSTSYGLIIELSRNEKLQKYRIILLQHTSYLHKWLVHFLICLLLLSLFFSGKFLNVCKPRTITFILEQQNLSPLTGWPTWVGILWKWASMLPKLAGDGVCRLALFHALKIFLANEIYHFSRLSHQTIYLGNLLHIISSLFSHFRSWDYPEHFGIYSQLDRKSKTWFFIFLNVYVSWIEWDKILMSQLSPPKFRYFADQNGPNGYPMKMNFDNSQMQKWSS